MAIRVFQLPQCQIYSGEKKQSHYVITLMRSVGKGKCTFGAESYPSLQRVLASPSSPFQSDAGGLEVCLPSCGMEAHLGV